MAVPKMSKNQMRRAKKKAAKVEARAGAEDAKAEDQLRPDKDKGDGGGGGDDDKAAGPDLDSDRVKRPDPNLAGKKIERRLPLDELDEDEYADFDDPVFAQFKGVFDHFGASHAEAGDGQGGAGVGGADGARPIKGTIFFDDDDDIPSEDDMGQSRPTRISKKRRKMMNKLSVAQLKALVSVPEVVEWFDVSSSDPRMLVQIKAHRNVVPVPGHWILKREYLSSKRGIEKPPFRLPKFIAETGITEMRDAVLEKQEQQTLKQKQRERVAPKMGRLDIDYQKLYDAFFRFQTKPDLSRFGEIYYEGKEAEVDFKSFRPGELGEPTREALGMPPGYPPPWLINQQRFGPPPSYPDLRIPGLNAPPPPGGSWGYHAGGWGKPPVDELNRPLYGGDVFGLTAQAGGGGGGGGGGSHNQAPGAAAPTHTQREPAGRTLWGELQPRGQESDDDDEDEDDEDDEDEEGGDEDDKELAAGMSTSARERGLEAGGYSSTVLTDYPGHGVETSVAGEMDLRKTRRGVDTEESSHPRGGGAPAAAAYTVLLQKEGRVEGLFGSERTYDVKGGTAAAAAAAAAAALPVLGKEDDTRKRKKPGDVDVAIDPDSLQLNDGLSRDEVRRRFEEGRRETGPGAQWAASSSAYDQDLSDMIAQESRKRQRVEEKTRERKREGKFKF